MDASISRMPHATAFYVGPGEAHMRSEWLNVLTAPAMSRFAGELRQRG